jgi:hypothetical protein
MVPRIPGTAHRPHELGAGEVPRRVGDLRGFAGRGVPTTTSRHSMVNSRSDDKPITSLFARYSGLPGGFAVRTDCTKKPSQEPADLRVFA